MGRQSARRAAGLLRRHRQPPAQAQRRGRRRQLVPVRGLRGPGRGGPLRTDPGHREDRAARPCLAAVHLGPDDLGLHLEARRVGPLPGPGDPLPAVRRLAGRDEDGRGGGRPEHRAGRHRARGLRTGHAGYAPGALTSAKLSYSYDGEHWTQAKASQHAGRWSAVVDHAGASGKPVSLKVELTDAKGATVTQTVVRAYDVR